MCLLLNTSLCILRLLHLLLQVCDCVSELAAGIIEDQGWPELLPFIFQCVQSGGFLLPWCWAWCWACLAVVDFS